MFVTFLGQFYRIKSEILTILVAARGYPGYLFNEPTAIPSNTTMHFYEGKLDSKNPMEITNWRSEL